MLRRTLRVILPSLIVALAGCGAAAPAGAAGAAVIGIGDQSPATFSDPRFLALGITTAREIVPWDVVTRRADRGDLAAFRAWLQAAKTANVTPLISFGADLTNPSAN